jgi:glycosyltransferase involved in cell wall biosynthesis
VRGLAPLARDYDIEVVCPNVPDEPRVVRDTYFSGVHITCPQRPLSVRWMHAGEMSTTERPLYTLLNWPSLVVGYLAQARQWSVADADVVIANGILAAYLAGRKQGPWKRIAVLHHLYQDPWTTGASTPRTGLHVSVERYLLGRLRVDAIAVVNPSVREHLVRGGFPSERVVLVGNGVDPAEYSFSPEHDEETVVFVGRLRKDKGVDTVLDAFSFILQRRPCARLHILGDGVMRSTLEAYAGRLGIGSHVIFRGFVDEQTKLAMLQRAALYLSASRFEGFGIPLVEAMATGAVPVVSDIPAHRHIFQGCEVGFLVASAASMAQRALELLDNRGLRSSMARNGRELVERAWTWDDVASRYRSLIEQSLGGEPVAGAVSDNPVPVRRGGLRLR